MIFFIKAWAVRSLCGKVWVVWDLRGIVRAVNGLYGSGIYGIIKKRPGRLKSVWVPTGIYSMV